MHSGVNILDLAVLGVILVSVAAGFYRGLLPTAFNTAGYLLSLAAAALFYGGAAMKVEAGGKVIQTLLYYSETSGMLGTVETTHTSVNGMTQAQLSGILQNVNFPYPLGKWYTHNVLNAVYAKDGISTLGDYLSRTVAETAVSILCFLAILFSVYVVVTLAVNLVHYVVKLPAARILDGTLGGVVGLARGVLIVFAVFMVVPVVLSILPVKQIQDLIASSHTAAFFYNKNFMFGMIRSFIG